MGNDLKLFDIFSFFFPIPFPFFPARHPGRVGRRLRLPARGEGGRRRQPKVKAHAELRGQQALPGLRRGVRSAPLRRWGNVFAAAVVTAAAAVNDEVAGAHSRATIFP